ncbi:MAG: pilus assembly protein [Desulfobacteria bacterium]
MTTRKSSAGLALLLSFLIALPSAALADDTELFTTSANPNVLLMLDTTGSMGTVAGSSAVGDLDGDGTSNTRMDILWNVVYTLLNADLSIPGGTATYTCKTRMKITTGKTYSSIQVNGANWSNFPATNGAIQIGSGGAVDNVTYASKSTWWGNYYFNFSPSTKFKYAHSKGETVSYTAAAAYGYPYPTSHTEATSTAFLNNLTTQDENILKARLGLMTFTTNWNASQILIDTWNKVSSTASNTPPFSPSYQNIWSSVTSYAYPSGGTPTAQALRAAQGFFDNAYNSAEVCRKNFAVMVTDGEDTMGGLDGATGSGYGPFYYKNGSNYSQTYTSGYTLNADGWSGYYGDGTPFNNGQVARNNAVIQEAANLASHSPSATLFTVGVGVSDTQPHLAVMREVLRRAAEQGNAQATNAQYDAIGASGDNTSRGAGRAFIATDATELSVALRNIFQQITAGMYSFTAPTVASVRMTDRNYLYKASFTPATPPATYWEGHLEALSINADNTMTSHWDADNVLKTTLPGDRRIYTSDNAWSRLDFTAASITPAMLSVDNTAVRDNVVDYVRGVNHDNNAKLGDIFHSKPVVVGPPSRFYFDAGYSTAVGGSGVQSFVDAKSQRKRVVYVGTNDGMLHAFLSGTYNTSTGTYDSGTGEELFGYIPYSLLGSLQGYVPGDVTRHGYFVDSSPRVADVWIDNNADGIKQSSEWKTVLIGGLRKGGTGYFALDVTDPPSGTDYTNFPKVLWEYVDPTNVGQTWSEPFIGKVKVMAGSPATAMDRWVAIFGGGTSDTGTVGASLVVLDIATGTPLKTFTTGIDNVIPASPAAVLDGSGYIKFVYVADLDGSVYKFDFRNAGTGTGYTEWSMDKIFQASAGQPAYHRIEPGSIIDESTRYLFFGTGDQDHPVSNTGTGKFYAVKDTDTFWPGTPLTESNLANLSSSITSLSGGTVGPSQSGWFVSFAGVPSTSNDTNTHSGEKVLSDPVVFYNNVFFTTFTPDTSNPCGGGGIARVYGLQLLNAGAGLASIAAIGETSAAKVPYHVYSGSEGGIPSSPSLSIYPSGQSSIFIGFSTGVVKEIKIESPPQMKTIKSWKEIF